jgi:hypothetical protein
MREVIERITCDTCGLVVDDAESVTVTIHGAEWYHTTFELDLCKDCRQTGGPFEGLSLLDVASKGRTPVATTKHRTKKRVPAKINPRSSEERWQECLVNGTYHCPETGCARTFTTSRKLGLHYGQAHSKKNVVSV